MAGFCTALNLLIIFLKKWNETIEKKDFWNCSQKKGAGVEHGLEAGSDKQSLKDPQIFLA